MLNYLKNMIFSTSSKMITYADYISTALYHPELGYYMKEGKKIGTGGDFITSSNISDVYGRAVAKWYSEIVKEINLPAKVCELGAGNGRFATAFIDEWKKLTDTPLTYFIVETSPYHRSIQQELIELGPVCQQISALDEIEPFSGMIFSNELYDALPVHVIEKKDGEFSEIMVAESTGKLIELAVPLQNSQITTFLNEYDLELQEGQRIEIPLQMAEVVSAIAKTLEKGIVVTVDYGYTNEEWEEPSRRKGSLRGYFQHQMVDNVLERPGEMDITSHVHFDALIKQGNERNLKFIAKLRQDEFLLSAGILDVLRDHFDPNPFSATSKRNRAIRSLIMPDGMSAAFHVIAQAKGLDFPEERILIERLS
ncbi:class I SAM-dependent methyltransferase [Bacillus sp. V33-4]|uniref:class I SAM-dependent methyltransferase n=1 Tax=Bacillus sp. V33-4 TaxID=2054169 RepID=UPI000C757829|nr:SAM-dependent methyltransferase [Bacillus sp. V33-4]PLR87690.1 SAM-dependent methyltransferase [Bacillus sp. V33-4]